MALALNKIILAGAGANTPGAYYQSVTISATKAANTLVPAGVYMFIPPTPQAGTSINLQVQNPVNTWTTVSANIACVTVISDGVNVRLNNTDATNTVTVTALTVDGGQAATGTYNT